MVHTMPKAKSELLANDTRIEALIKRVEAATGTDRMLNRDICEMFDPAEFERERQRSVKYGSVMRFPAFTASLDAVVELVERELPTSVWAVNSARHRLGAAATIWPEKYKPDKMPLSRADATTPALALLLAFLRALVSSSALSSLSRQAADEQK